MNFLIRPNKKSCCYHLKEWKRNVVCKSGLGPEEAAHAQPCLIVSHLPHQRTAHYDFSGVEIIPLVILYVRADSDNSLALFSIRSLALNISQVESRKPSLVCASVCHAQLWVASFSLLPCLPSCHRLSSLEMPW